MTTRPLSDGSAPPRSAAGARPPPRAQAALALVGAVAFLGVYAPQPILPSLRAAFGVGEARAAAVVSALALGVALSAPWAGVLSDALGRRRMMLGASLAVALLQIAASRMPTLPLLLGLRFLQGCVTPAILASAMAYASEEFRGRAGSATAAYVTGTVAGSVSGRLLASLLVDRWGWSGALGAVGALALLLAAAAAAWLPPSSGFVRSDTPALAALREPLRRPSLLGAYAVGFSALFSLVALFTFSCFRLAQPPFSLGSVALGSLFAVYLVGLPVTPLAGRLLDRHGPRPVLLGALAAAAVGAVITLSSWLPAVVLGLTLASSGVFVVQAAASTFVNSQAVGSRAAASGLYLSAYYAGGAVGALLPAPLWARWGWPAVVLAVVAVQSLAAAVARRTWTAQQALACGG